MPTWQETENQRYAIAHAPRYCDSNSWKCKVSKMRASQVLAIYLRFKRDGVL